MKNILTIVGVALYLLRAVSVHAQTPPVYDLNTARLEWNWAKGDGPPALGFVISCASTDETCYSTMRYLLGTTTLTIPVKDVVRTPGTYRCAAYAYGDWQSMPSNEISFTVDDTPIPPNGLMIKVE